MSDPLKAPKHSSQSFTAALQKAGPSGSSSAVFQEQGNCLHKIINDKIIEDWRNYHTGV